MNADHPLDTALRAIPHLTGNDPLTTALKLHCDALLAWALLVANDDEPVPADPAVAAVVDNIRAWINTRYWLTTEGTSG